MEKKSLSKIFQSYVENGYLSDHPKTNKKLKKLIACSVTNTSPICADEIFTYSNQSLNDYMSELEKLIKYPNMAVDTPLGFEGFSGIEAKNSLIYVKNISESKVRIVSFRKHTSKNGFLSHILYSGDVVLTKSLVIYSEEKNAIVFADNPHSERFFNFSVTPNFYGIFDLNGKFTKFSDELEEEIKKQISIDLEDYLEQENFLQKEPFLFN